MATKKANTGKAKTPALKKGEVLVGLTLADNKPHHLILLPGDEQKNWKDAVAWAKKQGGELPSRIDMLVLFERARDAFQKDWYWTGAPYAGDDASAWCQDFGYGGQDCTHEGGGLRCRAVRRVPVQ